ncbi:MAG: TonB-dependent receptor plug domain-containing protein [Bacteroidales bacterium]
MKPFAATIIVIILILFPQRMPAQQKAVDSVKTIQLVEVIIRGRRQNSCKSDYSFFGSKTETPVINIPQSISAVNKELIQDKMEFTLKDVADNVAGVNNYSGYDEYTIRGFRSENARNINGLRGYNTTYINTIMDRGQPGLQNSTDLKSTPVTISALQPGDYLHETDFSAIASFSYEFSDHLSFSSGFLHCNTWQNVSDHGINNYITPDSASLYYTTWDYHTAINTLSTYFGYHFNTGKISHQLIAGYDFVKNRENQTNSILNFPTSLVQEVVSWEHSAWQILNISRGRSTLTSLQRLIPTGLL